MKYLRYLKIPYKHQGRTFEGADCFGLLRLFYLHELGILLPDFTADYSESWFVDHDYFKDLYAEYGFQKADTSLYGNLIFFRNTSTRVGHLGIILTPDRFIHMTTAGCCIDSYLTGPWQRQIEGYYRYQPETA